MDTTTIIKRFEQHKHSRTGVENTWDVINRLITPYRGDMFQHVTSENAVDWRRREVYDSTAVMACQTLAASLHSALTTPAMRWFSLTFRKATLNKEQTAREWLEECGKRVYDALQDSNFNLEVNETYMDLCSMGTSIIVEEPGSDPLKEWKGINFTSMPIKECFFEQDAKGQVYCFYRLLNWECSRYIDKFGKENCPQIILDAYDADPQGKKEVVFCIYPIPENADADTSGILGVKRRPFGFRYVTRAGGEPFTGDAGSGGYYEMPAFAPRWRKTSESKWGNSPAMIALADVLTLNQTIEMRIKAIEKRIDPPQKVEDRALISDLFLQARGLTVMRDIDKIAPIDTGSDIGAGEIQVADLRAAINRYFFVDQLELKDSPAMTATEVMARADLMQRLLGPTQGRLQSDFLDLMIQRTFNIMLRARQLPPIPEVVAASDAEMDISYMGPLTRSQKADEVANTERWMMSLKEISEVLPDVLDVPDPDAIARGLAQSNSVPADMSRDEVEVKKRRKRRDDELQAQRELEMATMEGGAAKAMGEGEQAMRGAA